MTQRMPTTDMVGNCHLPMLQPAPKAADPLCCNMAAPCTCVYS